MGRRVVGGWWWWVSHNGCPLGSHRHLQMYVFYWAAGRCWADGGWTNLIQWGCKNLDFRQNIDKQQSILYYQSKHNYKAIALGDRKLWFHNNGHRFRIPTTACEALHNLLRICGNYLLGSIFTENLNMEMCINVNITPVLMKPYSPNQCNHCTGCCNVVKWSANIWWIEISELHKAKSMNSLASAAFVHIAMHYSLQSLPLSLSLSSIDSVCFASVGFMDVYWNFG